MFRASDRDLVAPKFSQRTCFQPIITLHQLRIKALLRIRLGQLISQGTRGFIVYKKKRPWHACFRDLAKHRPAHVDARFEASIFAAALGADGAPERVAQHTELVGIESSVEAIPRSRLIDSFEFARNKPHILHSDSEYTLVPPAKMRISNSISGITGDCMTRVARSSDNSCL